MKNLLILIVFFVGVSSSQFYAQQRTDISNQSEELGKVKWYRNYDEAISASKKEKKDIVLLFQEVPGCSTCRNYGHNVLSNPLMVEALENSFIPLAIFNNKGGHDKKILEKFNEPSWNNPVVRIINAEGENIVKRISSDYSAHTLSKRMIESLHAENKNVPKYLELLEQELAASKSNSIKEKTFQMYCFWSGEKELGQIEGVLDVESGFIGNAEVVKVKYDDRVVDENSIAETVKNKGIKPVRSSNSYRIAKKDVHYYLENSDYKKLPLSPLQKTKINSALGNNESALSFLSPKQLELLGEIQREKN